MLLRLFLFTRWLALHRDIKDTVLLSPRIKQTRRTKKKKDAAQFELLAAEQDFRLVNGKGGEVQTAKNRAVHHLCFTLSRAH